MSDSSSPAPAEQADSAVTDPLSRRPARSHFLLDGIAHSFMLGVGENYFAPFAIWLKASVMQIGLLSGLPVMVGTLSQLVGVWVMESRGGRRPLIVTGSFVQVLTFLPIAALPFVCGQGVGAASWLLFFCILYFSAANFTVPIWNSLVGDLIPAGKRAGVFGGRNTLSGFSLFAGLVGGGLWLAYSEENGWTASGFLALFLLAAAARGISVFSLSRYPERCFEKRATDYFSFVDFLRRTPKSNFARFVLFYGFMNMTVMIAGPYFSVFMLRYLNFSYREFMVVSATGVASQLILMKIWGPLADEFGTKKILDICSLGICILPVLWLVYQSPWYLIGVQCFSGLCWGGFNLAATTFLFDAVTPGKRARCTAYMSVVNAAGVLIGSLVGGKLLSFFEAHAVVEGAALLNPFVSLFSASTVARVVVVLFFLRLFREVRDVAPISHRGLVLRVVNVRPITGARFAPVLKDEDEEGEKEIAPDSTA